MDQRSKAALLVLVVAILFVGINKMFSDENQTADELASSTTSTQSTSSTASDVEPSSSTTSSANSTTSSSTTSTPTPSTIVRTEPPDRDKVLRERLNAFTQAYFSRNLDDTPESYRARVELYASEEFMADFQADVFDNGPFVELREQGISIEVIVSPFDVSITYSEDDESLVFARVSPILKRRQGGVTIKSDSSMIHETMWIFENGNWWVYPWIPD